MLEEMVKISIIGTIDSKTEKIMYYDKKIPKHIRDGIEKAKKLTNREVYEKALDCYRGYIERGDDYDYTRKSYLGGTFGDFEGDFNTRSDGNVYVKLADGREFTFKLIDFFNDIRNPQKRLF